MLNATEKEMAVKDLEVDVSKDEQDSTDDEDNKPKKSKENGVPHQETFKRALTDHVSFLEFNNEK